VESFSGSNPFDFGGVVAGEIPRLFLLGFVGRQRIPQALPGFGRAAEWENPQPFRCQEGVMAQGFSFEGRKCSLAFPHLDRILGFVLAKFDKPV
jgi:hypothetical protein